MKKSRQKTDHRSVPAHTFATQQRNQKPTTMPLNIALTNEQKILVTLAPTTESGNPATLDGEPTWTVEGDATVDVQPGGLSAYIVSGTPGASTVTVTADADLDADETRELSDIIAVTVVAAEAASLGFTTGTAEPK